MSPRTPAEGAAREVVRSARLGPDDAATLERRRRELGQSVSTYMRGLIRADGRAHPEARRGDERTES